MQQRTSQILYNYWNEVRGARLAPRRFEIEPSCISSILAETFVLERIDSRTYTFRLAGTRICEQFGTEFRGHNFVDLAGADRSALEQDLATITEQGAAGIFELVAREAQGRTVHFEVIVLPLIHGRHGVTRYVGCMSPTAAPPWLGRARLHPDGFGERRLMWPDGRPHAVIERTNRQAPFVPELATARIVRFNRQQFRVLDGGRKPGGQGERPD